MVRSERPVIQLQRPNAVLDVKRLRGDKDQNVNRIVLQSVHAGQLVHDPHVHPLVVNRRGDVPQETPRFQHGLLSPPEPLFPSCLTTTALPAACSSGGGIIAREGLEARNVMLLPDENLVEASSVNGSPQIGLTGVL